MQLGTALGSLATPTWPQLLKDSTPVTRSPHTVDLNGSFDAGKGTEKRHTHVTLVKGSNLLDVFINPNFATTDLTKLPN